VVEFCVGSLKPELNDCEGGGVCKKGGRTRLGSDAKKKGMKKCELALRKKKTGRTNRSNRETKAKDQRQGEMNVRARLDARLSVERDGKALLAGEDWSEEEQNISSAPCILRRGRERIYSPLQAPAEQVVIEEFSISVQSWPRPSEAHPPQEVSSVTGSRHS
jgi:hypothetical protein